MNHSGKKMIGNRVQTWERVQECLAVICPQSVGGGRGGTKKARHWSLMCDQNPLLLTCVMFTHEKIQGYYSSMFIALFWHVNTDIHTVNIPGSISTLRCVFMLTDKMCIEPCGICNGFANHLCRAVTYSSSYDFLFQDLMVTWMNCQQLLPVLKLLFGSES